MSHAIIDFKFDSEEALNAIRRQLVLLNCRYIQFRLFEKIQLKYLCKIASAIKESTVKAIDFIVSIEGNLVAAELIKFVVDNPKIRSLTLYDYVDNKVIKEANFGFGCILAVKEKIEDSSHCGVIAPIYFSSNIETFTESHHHNSCLNRKISIDTEGNIKNCPSMKESYGNIRDTTLMEALEKPGFKKYWNITKDQVSVCKDCEFRYICTDCRAYLEDPEDIYSKPLKCGYNPYTCEWEEWSTNPLKEKAIEHYGMQDLVKGKG